MALALQPFEQAAAAIQEWLDGAGAAFAVRTRQPDPRRKVASWDLQVHHAVVGTQCVRFSIRRDFPATAPQVHFDKKLCLVLPHIEEDGRFCHGIEAGPEDYDAPVAAAVKVIERLQWFLQKSEDEQWVRDEFQRECLAYWPRFCEQFRARFGAVTPQEFRAVLDRLAGVAEGKVAAYFRGSQTARSCLMLATTGEADPHSLAVRHGWSTGALVRGHALYVPVPADYPWTPAEWPRTFAALEQLVAAVTGNEFSVAQWVQNKEESAPHPFLVVLVQKDVCYGYLVIPSPIAGLMPASVIPVPLDRVDPDWALARDHMAPVLQGRRGRRVLLLGCGSLGSPVAELLARAGVGELHLLDKELFGPENCARHVLGAADMGAWKAASLAKRLRQMVPGVNVKSIPALAADWVRNVCKPGAYHLVVDCTGESTVRVMLARYREQCLGSCPVVHAWMEPYCAAAHVVHLEATDTWPLDDPVHKVNVATFNEETEIKLPACSAGFHPYGAADAWQAAGFAVERLVAVLDGKVQGSTVWSWVRTKAFFDVLPVQAQLSPLVPAGGTVYDAQHFTRPHSEVFGG